VTAASSSPVSDWIQRLPLLLIKRKADKTWRSILCGNQFHFTSGVNVYKWLTITQWRENRHVGHDMVIPIMSVRL